MKKLLFCMLTISVSVLMVSCGSDDEPSGGNSSGGGSSSGGNQQSDSHEYVDLGLPSGTLWATMNVGANSPEEYGDYFAWGETTPKQDYSWMSYKWYNTVTDKVTKYSSDVDSKMELDISDDAAYVNWGKKWRMPSYAQFKELREECTWTRTTMNGVKGRLVTSKKNGKTIFLPAAGCRSGGSIYDTGTYGGYWSHTLTTGDSYYAHFLEFNSSYVVVNYFIRYEGQSVRAVRVP